MTITVDGRGYPNFVREAFAQRMQDEITAPVNMAKNGGWDNWKPDIWWGLNEIRKHVHKLAAALVANDRDGVSHHCADVAIVLMKLSELYGTH